MDIQVLLTPEETAERLRISRTVLYELIRRNEIESIKLGRSRRIPVSAVEDFVTRLRKEAGQDVV
jgi:excisionase family DNA binding protein